MVFRVPPAPSSHGGRLQAVSPGFLGGRMHLPSPSPHPIFTGFQAQIHSTEETRSEGSSLYIRCPYTAQTTHQQQKAWCRLRNGQCEPLVETKGYSHTNWATKGRVALKDNPTERTVSVTMTELQAEDSGTYFCAYYYYRYHPLRTISLSVFKGEYLFPHTKSSHVRKQHHSFLSSPQLSSFPGPPHSPL